MNIFTLEKLEKLAKDRKDGIYSYGGYPYIVLDNHPKFCSEFGTIEEIHGSFTTTVWEGESHKLNQRMKKLYKLMKKI